MTHPPAEAKRLRAFIATLQFRIRDICVSAKTPDKEET
jgi:hypothetical protein